MCQIENAKKKVTIKGDFFEPSSNFARKQKTKTAKEPNNAEALYYLAKAEDGLGDTSKAKQYYQQVLKLHPDHPATLIALGLIANRAGNMAEVEKTHAALKKIDTALDDEFSEALKN